MAKEWIVPDADLGCDGAYFDYQELVRCMDCKWWEAVHGNTIGLCSHEDWTSHNLCNAVDKDGFCYRGESKDDWFCADGEREVQE